MTYPRTLNKRALIVYISLVCVFVVFLAFNVPWQEYVRIFLGYYEKICLGFVALSLLLVPFRLHAVKRRGLAPETRKVRFLGPFIDLAIDPLYDATLFYAGMFMFYTIFQERTHGLSLDPLLVLLFVAGILIYQSVTDLHKLGCEIFYVQTEKKVGLE